ncbi:hypothetical protein [Streptomyces sp. HPF1205]|uniref:hypothetical protein n=1 Tax=Streptomyces sp. HPF1205 TaxID=2873262 RepID=UPI001CEE05E7|nr:hypothetical protein [Streptomyces sp. HPF1205]
MTVLEWSVAAMGLALLAVGVIDLGRGRDAPPGLRRLPLLLCVPPLASALPRLLGAPHSVVLACDGLALAAGVTVVVIALRVARRPG